MIEIVALSRARADALSEGHDAVEAQFGWAVVDGDRDVPEVLPVLRDGLPVGEPPAWGTQLFVDVESVGAAGEGGDG